MNNEITAKEFEDIVLDKDLEELEQELNKFNLFDVLAATHNENLHSLIIKWLLDPEESHGLKDYFLKKFLMSAIIQNINNPYLKGLEITPVDIDAFDFNNSLIQTEEVFPKKRRGDISITNESNKLYILIENKIKQGEGDKQTLEYVEETEERYRDYNRIYIYLTPDGSAPESEKFITLGYSDLIKVIDEVLTSKEDEINDNAKFIISQLKRNVEVNILNESKIEELCLRIWGRHEKALETIIKFKPTNKPMYDTLGRSVVNKLKGDWKYHVTNDSCSIFRDDWKNKYKPKQTHPFFHYAFTDVGYGKIRIALHIENWTDEGSRRETLIGELNKMHFPENIEDANMENAQVILARKSVSKIDDDIDEAINKGKDDMVNLIKESWEYLDKASKSI